MIGGMMKSASKKYLRHCEESPGLLILLGALMLLLKTYVVQFSYNRVWRRLTENSGASGEGFRPLTFYEAFLVVILFTFLI